MKELVKNSYKVLVSLPGGTRKTSDQNVLRYERYVRKIASAKKAFCIGPFTPTQHVSKYHLLRVNLQYFILKNLNVPTSNPLRCNWQLVITENFRRY